ncbi:MAG TPA: site-specific integrase [Gallionella sp.]|nr:site-specific integrase [Gallionella sp.]
MTQDIYPGARKTLRQQMDDAMVLRGFALRTRESYLDAVKGLAKHYRRTPDSLSPQEVQDYFLHLVVERKLAYSSVNQAACACRFLFDAVLRRPLSRYDIPMAKVPKSLPRVLSRDEVKRVFAAASNLRARTLLMVAYAAGLRVSEVCALRAADIESAPDRMCIKVRGGKGGKDRYTMLSPALLQTLRDYWQACRPRTWLFPNPTGTEPITIQTAQRMYCAARDKAGLGRVGGIHTLRHCFATHLLESGVDIHTIQRLLGHGHVGTTMRYFHLAHHKLTGTTSPLELFDTALR